MRRTEFLLVLLITASVSALWRVRESIEDNPVPNPKAVVMVGNARFTVLTSQMIRMEQSQTATGGFVDMASLWFINRNMPLPSFTVNTTDGVTTIDTGYLRLRYSSGTFSARTLNITILKNVNNTVTWVPGAVNTGNLNGTVSALDCYTDACQDGIPLNPGLLSTLGWNVIDDSNTPLFNYSVKDGIPWNINPSYRNKSIDWYFFGYGWDFKQTLHDYTLVAGPMTIPPPSAFGTWWSRYWNYTQQEITDEIILGYKNHSLPLNHLVLDMDWHIETKDKQCNSWGGYTWNTGNFPDVKGFIEYVHGPQNQLKLLLNVHPNTGVDPCQALYPQLAKAIGFDTSQNATIPCDFASHLIGTNQFDIVMDPVGNDYFWTDYGGCSQGELGSSEYDLLWSNYLFDTELSSKGIRPLVLSRNGGTGNHRYPVGFSGDVFSVWPSLAFEVYMTPVAANILFGYWSHDTGGFHGDPPSDEMFLRWLQFASVEPIYRIHSDHEERRIWMFPSYEAMKDTMLFRNAISPYIYTQARKAYDTGVAIVHPLYYDFPFSSEAYSYKYQYMFGDDIFTAPVVSQGDNKTNTTSKDIWLPPGQWWDFNAEKMVTGPSAFTQQVPFDQIPIYFRAGAIIPMKDMQSVTNYNPDPVIFAIFPGAQSGSGEYYEDDGFSTSYLDGQFAFTSVTYTFDGTNTKVMVQPVQGSFKGQPQQRTFQILLVSAQKPKSVTFNSQNVPQVAEGSAGMGYWQGELGLVVQSSKANAAQMNTFSVSF